MFSDEHSIDSFRISSELIVEPGNLINRLFIKLKGTVSSLLTPKSNSAMERQARVLCRKADKLLAKAHSLESYKQVVDNLTKAHEILKQVDETLSEICLKDLNASITFFRQRTHERALDLIAVAETELNKQQFKQAKTNFETAVEYLKTIYYADKIKELESKVKFCEKQINIQNAKENLKQAENFRANEEYSKAIACVSNALQLYSLPNYTKEFEKEIAHCENFISQLKLEKEKMIEKYTFEGNRLKQNAISALQSNNCELAQKLMVDAKARFKKAECFDQVKACTKFNNDCKEVVSANGKVFEADKKFNNLKLADAKQEYLSALTVFKKHNVQAAVQSCNAKLTACEEKIKQFKAEGDKLFGMAKTAFFNNNVDNAIENFKKAQAKFESAGYANQTVECQNFIIKCEKLEQANNELEQADDCLNDDELFSAINHLSTAKNLFSTCGLTNFVNSCEQKLEVYEQKLKELIGQANSLYNSGVSLYREKSFSSAIDKFEQANELYIKAGRGGDANDCCDYIRTCNDIIKANRLYKTATDLYNENKEEDAINYYQQAKAIYLNYSVTEDYAKNCDTDIEDCYMALGNRYFDQGQDCIDNSEFDKAIELLTQAKQYFEIIYKLDDMSDCDEEIERARYNDGVETYNRALDTYDSASTYSDYLDAKRMFERAEHLGCDCSSMISACDDMMRELENSSSNDY